MGGLAWVEEVTVATSHTKLVGPSPTKFMSYVFPFGLVNLDCGSPKIEATSLTMIGG